jgi:allophanate hydrolase
LTETIAEILDAYRSGAAMPADIVARSYARIRAHDDPAMFIALRDERAVMAEAQSLAGGDKTLPLYGIPVAVKDNIDVAGMPTTAACPGFAYRPAADATAVARLRAAGALLLGKLNLDQFATGLVGTRSPYGTPRNLFDARLIPGGSSSGSGVAVGAGIVPLTLGTDTAGSGRVPAGFNNIVGLKPSVGSVSTFGVIPACRTLDCVTVFTLTVDDAMTALNVMAGFDEADPYSRPRRINPAGAPPGEMRLGVPRAGQRQFFGDKASAAAYDAALAKLAALGGKILEVDFEPFYETARLLYDGPWVAERYVVAKDLLNASPEAILPVTRQIIAAGRDLRTADAFTAFYRLEELRRIRDGVFAAIDALVVPTAPTTFTIAEVLAEPVELNNRLGTYTNFVNLLDLCGLAVPASIGANGLPFGITLLAPGGDDAKVAALGREFHGAMGLPLGALKGPRSG